MNIMKIFPDPDDMCQMEYRAIYEHLKSVLSDCPEEERHELCKGMLEEFELHAKSMLKDLENAQK